MKKVLILIILFVPLVSMSDKIDNDKPTVAQIEVQNQSVENMLQEWKERYEKALKEKPPLPPWLKFPTYDRYSLGWRMGEGESYMESDIGPYFHFASQYEKEKYKLKYPPPSGWEGWYDE